MYKVIFIDNVAGHGTNVPLSINDGNNYFTYGWAGISARKFKEFNSDVTVECWKTDYKAKQIYTKEISGVTFKIYPAFRIKYFGDYSRKLIKDLKKELNKKEPTIVHITSFRHLLFYSTASKLKDYPLVVQNNGESSAIYKISISSGKKKFLYKLHSLMEKRAFQNIDLLYILDNRIKAYLPDTKALILKQTLGVIEERFVPFDKREARIKLQLDPQKKYLLYIGRLNYTKRPDILIDIFKELKRDRDDVELIIAGSRDGDPLLNYARECGVKIFGIISHLEIFRYLSAADVYILVRYSKEHIFGGIGLLPVEALLCNTPVVGESLQNFPEEFRDSVGFYVTEPEEIKEAILKVIDKKTFFYNLREIAIKHYSWESIAKRTGEDFKALLKKYYNTVG